MKQHSTEKKFVRIKMDYDGEGISFSPFPDSLLEKLSGRLAISKHFASHSIDVIPVELAPLNEPSGVLYIRLNHGDPAFFEILNYVFGLLSPLVEGNRQIYRIEQDSSIGIVVS